MFERFYKTWFLTLAVCFGGNRCFNIFHFHLRLSSRLFTNSWSITPTPREPCGNNPWLRFLDVVRQHMGRLELGRSMHLIFSLLFSSLPLLYKMFSKIFSDNYLLVWVSCSFLLLPFFSFFFFLFSFFLSSQLPIPFASWEIYRGEKNRTRGGNYVYLIKWAYMNKTLLFHGVDTW